MRKKHCEHETHHPKHDRKERGISPMSSPETQKRGEQKTNSPMKLGLPKAGGKLAVPVSMGYGKRKKMADGGKADGDHWIQKAIKHPGALRKKLHVKEGHDIPAKKMDEAEHSANPKTRRQARLAETLKSLHKR